MPSSSQSFWMNRSTPCSSWSDDHGGWLASGSDGSSPKPDPSHPPRRDRQTPRLRLIARTGSYDSETGYWDGLIAFAEAILNGYEESRRERRLSFRNATKRRPIERPILSFALCRA
jgi:hypothetical protein